MRISTREADKIDEEPPIRSGDSWALRRAMIHALRLSAPTVVPRIQLDRLGTAVESKCCCRLSVVGCPQGDRSAPIQRKHRISVQPNRSIASPPEGALKLPPYRRLLLVDLAYCGVRTVNSLLHCFTTFTPCTRLQRQFDSYSTLLLMHTFTAFGPHTLAT